MFELYKKGCFRIACEEGSEMVLKLRYQTQDLKIHEAQVNLRNNNVYIDVAEKLTINAWYKDVSKTVGNGKLDYVKISFLKVTNETTDKTYDKDGEREYVNIITIREMHQNGQCPCRIILPDKTKKPVYLFVNLRAAIHK